MVIIFLKIKIKFLLFAKFDPALHKSSDVILDFDEFKFVFIQECYKAYYLPEPLSESWIYFTVKSNIN